MNLNQLLFIKTDNIFIQFFRYFWVGGIAFLVDFGTLFYLTEFLSVYYLISAMIAFLCGLTTNYLLSIKWVFSTRKYSNITHEIIVFSLIGIIGLGLNELIMWTCTERLLKFHYLLSKIISTFFVYVWNFFARKFLLFN